MSASRIAAGTLAAAGGTGDVRLPCRRACVPTAREVVSSESGEVGVLERIGRVAPNLVVQELHPGLVQRSQAREPFGRGPPRSCSELTPPAPAPRDPPRVPCRA